MSKDQRSSRRKKHRNSKLGCATCKRRRVKCLETLPECTNCEKHGSRCEYLDYTEAQLSNFNKAKHEYEARESFRRARITDSLRQLAKKISSENGHVGLGHLKDLALENEAVTGGIGLPLSTYFTQPHVPGSSLATKGLLYPDIPMSRTAPSYKGDMGIDSHLIPFENSYASPLASHSTLVDSLTDVHHDVVSTSGERLRFDSEWSSHDLMSKCPSGVARNFDDLLTEQGHLIVYPVYTFRNSSEPHWNHSEPEENGTTDGTIQNNADSLLDLGTSSTKPTKNQLKAGNPLPYAEQTLTTFHILCPEDMDFDARFHLYIINLGPLISTGKADLQQIRGLYHAWLGHFIFKAYRLSIMFLCLTNLTTNYLITNVFRTRGAPIQNRADHDTRLRRTLLTHLIQNYSTVIKSLRSLLNKNSDPQLASSLSYILSIMSIYDPEATVESIVCFRDGMFSVLSHTLQFCKNSGVTPPLFVPIHMQLAANVVRTVYFPAYNPGFLCEYEIMLRRLGEAINSINPTEIRNQSTFRFIVEVYDDLWKFCQESIRMHIPTVNNNLTNIPLQLDIFFIMFRQWANLGPSRLLTVRTSTDPLEKVLNLFFRLFRKAVYAVVPQVRFCFLRDFDSPLMLDVFPNSCDANILYSLDDPETLCLVPEAYSRILTELKLLSAYAIRINTFLTMRIAILYQNLVYNDTVRNIYPINNIVDWKNSISDIHATRKEFQERIGLHEICIKEFNKTYISKSHYPQILEPDASSQVSDVLSLNDHNSVDLFSLQPHGLLRGDELPSTTKDQ